MTAWNKELAETTGSRELNKTQAPAAIIASLRLLLWLILCNLL